MEGARNGACTMIGGDAEVFRTIEPIFNDICVENGLCTQVKAEAVAFKNGPQWCRIWNDAIHC